MITKIYAISITIFCISYLIYLLKNEKQERVKVGWYTFERISGSILNAFFLWVLLGWVTIITLMLDSFFNLN